MTEPTTWSDLVPEPRRPRPDNLKWDVFLSYRSKDRAFVLALYDALTEAGFDVFVDQFVLAAGSKLQSELSRNLEASAAGILVWSDTTAESSWCEDEFNAMRSLEDERKREALPFHLVPCRLNQANLPRFLKTRLYVDCSGQPAGPRGEPLLRLMYGIAGQPLPAGAVRLTAAASAEAEKALTAMRTSVKRGRASRIIKLAEADGPAWQATPLLLSTAVDSLCQVNDTAAALKLNAVALKRFPKSLRLRQLQGKALRRSGQHEDAGDVLGDLYEEGHRDPETVGMYAATWFEAWNESGNKADLEEAQRLYAEAFALQPLDVYTGINAAAKAWLLGKLEDARTHAAAVFALTDNNASRDGSNYWDCVSRAEALLLMGETEQAFEGYRAGVKANHRKTGTLLSTGRALAALLPRVIDDKAEVARFLSLFPEEPPA